MPTLHWIGKDKVINHHTGVPFRVLEHNYGYWGNDQSDNFAPHSGNKIIHGVKHIEIIQHAFLLFVNSKGIKLLTHNVC